MQNLFIGVTNAIKGIFNLFKITYTHFVEIELFQLVMAILFLAICISLIFYFVKQIKQGSNNKIKSYDIGNAKASYIEGNKHIAEYKGIKNGQVVYYKKIWDKNGNLVYDGSKNVDETLG